MTAINPLLRMEKVEVLYQKMITAIHGVSLDVFPGQIAALLGANGAGKTTTLRAVTGFLGSDDAKVSEGRIWLDGEAIENRQPHEVAARGIALVPERNKIFETLTVIENLDATGLGSVKGDKTHRQMIERVFEYFPRLAPARDRLAGYLSGGERQMLAMGAALVCRPRLLLVDEMSLGLAPRIVEELLERLVTMKKERALPCCWWNRVPTLRSKLRTTDISWKTGASSWTERPSAFASTRTCRSSILAKSVAKSAAATAM